MTITVSSVSGNVLDTVTFDGRRFTFDTGAAEPMFTAKVAHGIPAQAVAEFYADWSNGYVTTQAVNGVDAG